MTGIYRIGVVDYDGTIVERSWRINIFASTAVAQDTKIGAFKTALNGVQRGVIRLDERSYQTTDTGILYATSSVARNSVRWRYVYRDNVTGKVYRDTLPTARIDNAGLVVAGTVDWNPLATPWVNFKAAFEDIVRSVDGNPVTLQRVFLLD